MPDLTVTESTVDVDVTADVTEITVQRTGDVTVTDDGTVVEIHHDPVAVTSTREDVAVTIAPVVTSVTISGGMRGLSAYDIAVQNGFVGTEQEWLLSLGESVPYELRLDDVGAGVTYVGEADPGSANGDDVWRIKRITESGADIVIEWANGSSDFENEWDDRLTLPYS